MYDFDSAVADRLDAPDALHGAPAREPGDLLGAVHLEHANIADPADILEGRIWRRLDDEGKLAGVEILWIGLRLDLDVLVALVGVLARRNLGRERGL